MAIRTQAKPVANSVVQAAIDPTKQTRIGNYLRQQAALHPDGLKAFTRDLCDYCEEVAKNITSSESSMRQSERTRICNTWSLVICIISLCRLTRDTNVLDAPCILIMIVYQAPTSRDSLALFVTYKLYTVTGLILNLRLYKTMEHLPVLLETLRDATAPHYEYRGDSITSLSKKKGIESKRINDNCEVRTHALADWIFRCLIPAP
ncbi:hypothetical protein H0H93_009577 [Arthromyces matolae]|nr:hypothetical protein H0H93_009577 [Arthromyces matolae]